MIEPIKVPAMLDQVKTMKDGGIKVSFETQELNSERCASLFSLKSTLVWLIIVDSASKQVEIPDEPPTEFKADKTPSQRLRAVLFLWWQQLGKQGDFDSFYKQKMETLIEWTKEKLQDA